jgi:hypothetical protein
MKRKYLPNVFIAYWSCGKIMDVTKMYTAESTSDVVEFLTKLFTNCGEYPSIIYYDRACILVKSLFKLREKDSRAGVRPPPS